MRSEALKPNPITSITHSSLSWRALQTGLALGNAVIHHPVIHFALEPLFCCIKKMEEYGWRIAQSMPPTLKHTTQMIWMDLLPIAGACMLFHATDTFCRDKLPAFLFWMLWPLLTALNMVLACFVLLRNYQATIHSTILLIKLSNMLHAAKMDDVKAMTCKKCNALRWMGGEIRTIILLSFVQQRILTEISTTPFVGWILSVMINPLFIGRLVADYAYAHCADIRANTFYQYWELFFLLGLMQQLSTFSFSALGEYYLNIPRSTSYACVSSILIVYFVRLAFAIRLPQPVEESHRCLPAHITDIIANQLVKLLIFQTKNMVQSPESIFHASQLIQRYTCTIQSWKVALSLRLPIEQKTWQCFFHLFFPKLFRGLDGLFTDPIVSDMVATILFEMTRVLNAMERYHQFAKEIANWIEQPIHAIETRPKLKQAVELIGWAFHLDQIFTADFILNNGIGITKKLEMVLGKSSEVMLITQFRKNLELLNLVFQHCDMKTMDGLIQILKEEKFITALATLKNSFANILTQYKTALVPADWDHVDCEQPKELSDAEWDQLLKEWKIEGRSIPAINNGATIPRAPVALPANIIYKKEDDTRHDVLFSELKKPKPKKRADPAGHWTDSSDEESYHSFRTESVKNF